MGFDATRWDIIELGSQSKRSLMSGFKTQWIPRSRLRKKKYTSTLKGREYPNTIPLLKPKVGKAQHKSSGQAHGCYYELEISFYI